MRTTAKRIHRVALISLALLLATTAGSRVVLGQAQHVRWDIVSLNFPPAAPLTISAGGISSARANDGSQITLTGSGTFVAPGGPGRGANGAVTGGGTWTLCGPPAPATPGCVTGVSGTYEVTGLVRWDPAPFPPGGPPPRTDLIDEGVPSTGLAVLSIVYNDGERGTLVVSCTGATAPASMFEGITASKGYVDYWNRVAPTANVDANRTIFHIK